ncbi:MAG: hypothetical protein V1850_00405 [Candidatus Bathyarchaeota archaeon]
MLQIRGGMARRARILAVAAIVIIKAICLGVNLLMGWFMMAYLYGVNYQYYYFSKQ